MINPPGCAIHVAGCVINKDSDGNPVAFKSVGAVVVLRQLHQMVRACKDEPLSDGLMSPLHYETKDGFPPKSLVDNPFSDQVTDEIGSIFQAVPPASELGAEYTPKDLVWWI